MNFPSNRLKSSYLLILDPKIYPALIFPMEYLNFFFFFSVEKRPILLLGKSSICCVLPTISRSSLKSYVDDLGFFFFLSTAILQFV